MNFRYMLFWMSFDFEYILPSISFFVTSHYFTIGFCNEWMRGKTPNQFYTLWLTNWHWNAELLFSLILDACVYVSWLSMGGPSTQVVDRERIMILRCYHTPNWSLSIANFWNEDVNGGGTHKRPHIERCLTSLICEVNSLKFIFLHCQQAGEKKPFAQPKEDEWQLFVY